MSEGSWVQTPGYKISKLQTRDVQHTRGAGSRAVDLGSSVVGRGDGLALRGHPATSRDFFGCHNVAGRCYRY